MALTLSDRSHVAVFRALDILQQANKRAIEGENLIRMEAGQPCVGAPMQATEYGRKMLLDDPVMGYTAALGLPALRERISDFIQSRYGVSSATDNIAVTIGSSGGFLLAFMAVFNPGDTVAITTPTYAAYRNILKSLSINVLEIETSPETNYQPTLDLLASQTEKFDGIILASPSNPTGCMMPEKDLKAICEWCDEKGVRVISDEVYHGITYGQDAVTARKYSDSAIISNSFSKYFAMTGWRLGWLDLPSDVMARVKLLAENLFVSPPALAQHIAWKVFDHLDVLDGYVEQYKTNLDILKERLPAAGIPNFASCDGAFYVYADVSDLTNDSETFCRNMMDEAGVCTTPGIDFDAKRGHATIRMSYAGCADDINAACDRLQSWLMEGQRYATQK